MKRFSFCCAAAFLFGAAPFLSAPAFASEAAVPNFPEPVAVVVFSRGEQTPAPDTVDGLTSASLMPGSKKIGTTRFVAEEAARVLNADIFAIEPRDPLPVSFQETISRNHRGGALPLKPLPDLRRYRTIVLAGPNWSMSSSLPVRQFLKDAAPSLNPEALVTITTHAQYGSGRMSEEAAAAFPGARHAASLAFEDHDIHADPKGTLSRVWAAFGAKGDEAAAASSRGVRVICEVAGREIPITLNGTPEADQFLAMLPLTAAMGEYGGREFYGAATGPRRIEASSRGQYTFLDGTLTYCPTNDTLAIFYSQSSRPRLTMAVFPMGRVTGDLKVFGELPDRAEFTFRRAP